MFYLLIISILTGTIMLYSCTLDRAIASEPYEVDILESPQSRITNKKKYFKKEYERIKIRRASFSNDNEPISESLTPIIGLGLSGGGIKSTSFQLGLLSGLHSVQNAQNISMLDKVDYLSSVSGGSWANGAYIATSESDDVLFECLDKVVLEGCVPKKCTKFKRFLAISQENFWGSKDWQTQIINNFLDKKDVTLQEIRTENAHFSKRPFPIFMSTHSNTIIGKKTIKNFPFEITPFSIGTIADCNSKGISCGFFRRYLRPLHWYTSPEKGFMIDLDKGTNINISVKKYVREEQNKLSMSHAMWASGGLVAKILSLHLRLSIDEGNQIPNVRKKYVLSDGGKTDNLGLIPLVERGAKLIVISQIASDPELKYGDLQRSADQLEKLFGLGIDTTALKQAHAQAIEKKTFIAKTHVKDKDDDIAELWMIKPTIEDVLGLERDLDRFGKYKFLASYLVEEFHEDKNEPPTGNKNKKFPQIPTLKTNYNEKEIYAFYSLGKYIGENHLSPEIKQWLGDASK